MFRSQFKSGDVVIHGGARGVDTWAEEVANGIRDVKILRYLAYWDKDGKAAGVIRNSRMFDDWTKYDGYKRALILWDGESHGTRHMLRLVEQAGAPLTLLRAGYD